MRWSAQRGIAITAFSARPLGPLPPPQAAGLDLLIEASAGLPLSIWLEEAPPRAHLRELRELAASRAIPLELEPPPAVHLLAAPTRKSSLLAVLPAERLIRGLALGRPTLAANLPNASEVITPRKVGLLHAAGNPADLRAQLTRMLANPDGCARLAAAALERARSYTPIRAAARLRRAIDQLERATD